MALSTLRSLFGKTASDPAPEARVSLVGPRIPRHSSGWASMLKHLQEEEALQVLDIGPTSASSINLLTSLGHSLYMSELVIEVHHGEWVQRFAEDPPPIEDFIDQNLDFGGRRFDVVLLWTTLDYVPAPLIPPMIARLYDSMNPSGRILAFFHTKMIEDERVFYRHHITAAENVEMQEAHRLAIRQIHSNRNIERLFSAYQGCKFFLAKDNLAEVIVTR